MVGATSDDEKQLIYARDVKYHRDRDFLNKYGWRRVINAKTSSRVGDVHTGSRLRSITRGRSVTIAWELGKGARPTSAWGANKSVNQMLFARS